jgi:hypothetical protein
MKIPKMNPPTAIALLISCGLILYYGSQGTWTSIIVFFLSMIVIYSFNKSRFIILMLSCVISGVFFKLNQVHQSRESMSTKNVKTRVPPLPPVKPVPVNPVPVNPVAVKPVAVKPVPVNPVAVKPVAVKPVAVKPVAVKPVAVKPASEKEDSFMPNIFGAGTLSESYENMEKQQKNLMSMVKMVQPMMKQTEALMSKIPPDMMKQAMDNMKGLMKKK